MSWWSDETCEWYAEKYGEYPTNRLAVDALELTGDPVVVDVGCGTGAALRHVAEQLDAATLIGVDPGARMIEIARERTDGHPGSDRITFHTSPAESLPLEDDVADLVLAFDSFDHWQDKDGGLAQIRRILKRSGRLVVVKDGSVPGGKKAGRELLAALTGAGFEVVEQKPMEGDGVTFTMWICKLEDPI